MKKVTVVILNFKVKNLTIACIDSVRKSTYKNIKIIVIDNDSGDGIANEIVKIKGIQFIQNKDNLGFSGGNNVGIKKALESRTDYVFILNPDTIIEKNTVSFLTEAAESENAGITGPKILFTDKKTIWYAGGIIDKNNVLGLHRGVNQKDLGQYDEVEKTDYVTGAAMMVKKEVFEKIGFFDARYFLYYEDSDFCFRARETGFKILYVPKGIVYHKVAQSTGLGSSIQEYYITRNRMLFAAKFLSLRTRFALLREVLKNIVNPTKRLALFDFLMGNFGKGSI